MSTSALPTVATELIAIPHQGCWHSYRATPGFVFVFHAGKRVRVLPACLVKHGLGDRDPRGLTIDHAIADWLVRPHGEPLSGIEADGAELAYRELLLAAEGDLVLTNDLSGEERLAKLRAYQGTIDEAKPAPAGVA